MTNEDEVTLATDPVKYDIVIPNWNQKEKCIACLKSIAKHTQNYRVIFVDNGSDQDQFDEIYEVLVYMPNILIRNEKNEGFVKAVNKGLEASDAPFVIVQNNDTEVTEGWVERLERAPFDIVGPVTSPCLSWQSCDRLMLVDKRIPKFTGDNNSYAKLLAEKCDRQYTSEKAMVAFFCTLIRREVIDKVGLLAEEFGVGFADDDDYCARARKEGFKVGAALDSFVMHHHRSTFKTLYSEEEIKDMQDKNLSIYYAKKNGGEYEVPSGAIQYAPQPASQMTIEENTKTLNRAKEVMTKGQKVTTRFFDIEELMNGYMQSYDEKLIKYFDGTTKIGRRKFEQLVRGAGFAVSFKASGDFTYTAEIVKL